ncbi:MAG: hypothetical protein VYC39_06500 [Myxococcota bacterium]|nr:hypothetical protein [Myxococcota bacterium]
MPNPTPISSTNRVNHAVAASGQPPTAGANHNAAPASGDGFSRARPAHSSSTSGLPSAGRVSTSPQTTRFGVNLFGTWVKRSLATPEAQAEYQSLSPAQKSDLRVAARNMLKSPTRKKSQVGNAAWLWTKDVIASHEKDSSAAAALVKDIVRFTENEKNPNLRRQMSICLIQAGIASKKLKEEILPSAPPYQTIFKGNSSSRPIEITIFGDDEIIHSSKYRQTFEAAGAKVRTKRGGLEIDFQPSSPSGTKFRINVLDSFHTSYRDVHAFRAMRQNTAPIQGYNFHSQYGTALDPSIQETRGNKELEKLYIMAACKSKVFADRVQKLFPKTQFIWTHNSELVSDTPKMLIALLGGLANRESWEGIRGRIQSSDIYRKKSYVFPDDIRKLSYVDSDHDGIADHVDQLLSPTLKKLPSEETLSPRIQDAHPRTLEGIKAHHAVQLAKGLLGYIGFTATIEDKFEGHGWTTCDVNGPLATFSPGAKPDTFKVSINSAYSHVSEQALAIALSQEIFNFVGQQNHVGMRWLSDRQKQVAAFAAGVQLMNAWDRKDLFSAYASQYPLPQNLGHHAITQILRKYDGVSGPAVKKLDKLFDS